MKKATLLTGLACLVLPFFVNAQCTTTNATTCVCETPGSTDCDLLPDIIVGRPPLLVSGNNGVIEYSQTGNGSNDGRLRVSVSSPNIGHGPLEIRTTNMYICGTDTITGTAPATCPNTGLPPRQLITQRVYHKTGNTMSYYDRNAGSMTYHPTHGHMHVDDWGIYTLRTMTPDPDPLTWPIIGTGAKLAFCLMDYGSCSTYNGHCVDSLGNTLLNNNFPNYGLGGGSYNCSPTVQGISSGYTDIYYQYLDGMYIDIPPGTCNGDYYIVVQLDPYDYFLEENENNNVIVVPYTLTQQVLAANASITASNSGPICSTGNVTLSADAGTGFSYLWSNGDTTQNITVNTPGNYTVTVTTPCGTATSQPYTVSLIDIPPQTSGGAVCDQGTVDLSANAGGGVIDWFDVPTGGTSLFTGNIFSTPSINTTTTYYAQATTTAPGFSAYNEPHANTIGGGGYFTGSQSLIFDAIQNFTLTSVKVYAQSAATTTVELKNSSGTIIYSQSFSIPSGESRITLNWNIAAGNDYSITRTGSAALYRNNGGVTYPYDVTNYLSIKNSTAGTSFYYFFYDWEVTIASPVCVSDRVPAVATVYPNPSVSQAPFADVCVDASPVSLSGGSPAGGTYSGTGVSGNTFDPSVAGIGTHNITYEYTDGNGCTGSAVETLTVNELPNVTLNLIPGVCIDTPPFSLTGGLPLGGTFSGPGVTNNIFDPAAAGVGIHTITYTYTNGFGCSFSVSGSLEVYPLPVVTLDPFAEVCLTDPPFALSGGSPAGGTYSGNGVSSNMFDPSAAGIGLTTITYTYSDGNGCTGSATQTINVKDCGGCTPPVQPAAITGAQKPCAGVNEQYVADPVPGATSYNWTVPAEMNIISGQGTNVLTVVVTPNFSYGPICVTAENSCGVSPARCKNLNKQKAYVPGKITGDIYGNCGATNTLTAVPASGAISYDWTLPAGFTIISGQGTNSITYQGYVGFFAGQVCVTAFNGCATSNPRCINIYGPPAKPQIGGANFGCVGQVNTYFVNPVPNASTYTWTVPNGSTILTGQGTTTIDVMLGSNSGSVRCFAENACGNKGFGGMQVDITCRVQQALIKDAGIKVQPNPANNYTEIILDGIDNETISLELINMIGKKVYEGTHHYNSGQSIPLDLSELSKGVYFISIKSDSYQLSAKLIVE